MLPRSGHPQWLRRRHIPSKEKEGANCIEMQIAQWQVIQAKECSTSWSLIACSGMGLVVPDHLVPSTYPVPLRFGGSQEKWAQLSEPHLAKPERCCFSNWPEPPEGLRRLPSIPVWLLLPGGEESVVHKGATAESTVTCSCMTMEQRKLQGSHPSGSHWGWWQNHILRMGQCTWIEWPVSCLNLRPSLGYTGTKIQGIWLY